MPCPLSVIAEYDQLILAGQLHFDIFLVALSALFAWIAFGVLTGDGENVVIREGTIILAFFTGLCMKITDPLVDRIFLRKTT